MITSYFIYYSYSIKMIKKIYFKFFKSKEKYNEFKQNDIYKKQKVLFNKNIKSKLEKINKKIIYNKELNFYILAIVVIYCTHCQ